MQQRRRRAAATVLDERDLSECLRLLIMIRMVVFQQRDALVAGDAAKCEHLEYMQSLRILDIY